jgi:outer membrane lipoprotein-sorting protein
MEKRTNEVQSKLAHALLSGRFSIAKDMKIQRESENSFALIPKKGSAGTVTNARIEISVAEKLINKVVLEHKGGNRSEITLTHIELGKPLEDKLFIFEAPANTDKVSQ